MPNVEARRIITRHAHTPLTHTDCYQASLMGDLEIYFVFFSFIQGESKKK